jgi:hypothetical protein
MKDSILKLFFSFYNFYSELHSFFIFSSSSLLAQEKYLKIILNHTSLIYANFFFTDIVGLADPRLSIKTKIK